jgi:hypothetical protein
MFRPSRDQGKKLYYRHEIIGQLDYLAECLFGNRSTTCTYDNCSVVHNQGVDSIVLRGTYVACMCRIVE